MTIREDDRTEEQLKTHTILVTATDKFLSGWGQAKGGDSKCAWACSSREIADKVFKWVSERKEMKYVGMTDRPWRPHAAHVHIYVVDENHPALN